MNHCCFVYYPYPHLGMTLPTTEITIEDMYFHFLCLKKWILIHKSTH